MLPLIYLLIYYHIVICNFPTSQYVAEVADRKTHYAHKYHGIDFSTRDEFGNKWFKRNGKECRLFTEPFEAWFDKQLKKGAL